MNADRQPAACPLPVETTDVVTLAHGEGGRLSRQLIRERIVSQFGSSREAMADAADIGTVDGSLAMTTDSFVVSPLFFPGGDIGSLAVYGTANDLAVSGARPLWLTLSLIIEEGFSLQTLDRVIESVRQAAALCEISVVAGDTKVVPVGAADGLFINTAGVGRFLEPRMSGLGGIEAGDAILVSGPIGKHGMAVMSSREGFGFTPPLQSDSAPLQKRTASLQESLGEDLVTMRDATRGGVAAVLHEWAEASGMTMRLKESAVPVTPDVRGASELLGLDPLYVANEGTFVAVVRPDGIERALDSLRTEGHELAAVIGTVVDTMNTAVVIERMLGTLHPLDEPAGAPLPRIC